MRNKFTKIAMMMGLGFALTFAFGCSDNGGSNTESNGTGKLSYQGKTYKTVKIGRQIWMAENLNYDVNGSKCYDNKPANCDKYGRLYNWVTAKNVCPDGWHLPNNADWDKLCHYVDSTNGTAETPYESQTAGKYLKSKNDWNAGGNGEDNHGFNALPGGSGNSSARFNGLGSYGSWWSASENGDDYAYHRLMYYNYDTVNFDHDDKQILLFSVRCVQDKD